MGARLSPPVWTPQRHIASGGQVTQADVSEILMLSCMLPLLFAQVQNHPIWLTFPGGSIDCTTHGCSPEKAGSLLEASPNRKAWNDKGKRAGWSEKGKGKLEGKGKDKGRGGPGEGKAKGRGMYL